MDTASGRFPCDAQNCDQSSCAAIRNNYDASTRTFKAPPTIRRSDGSDALRQREPRVYTAPFQVSRYDQEKVQRANPQGQQQQQQQEQQPNQDHDAQQHDQHQQQPNQYDDQQQQHQHDDAVTPAGQPKKSRRTKTRNRVTTPTMDQAGAGHHDQSQQQPAQPYHPRK